MIKNFQIIYTYSEKSATCVGHMTEGIRPGQHGRDDGAAGEEDVHGHGDVADDHEEVGDAEAQDQVGEQSPLHARVQQREDGDAGTDEANDDGDESDDS